jgi:hypothetical protein
MITIIYSKEAFIERMEKLNITDDTVENMKEYFICINSTSGPDSTSYFLKEHPNVISMQFDDCEKDETKWGDDINCHYTAIAMSIGQAEELIEFIQRIKVGLPVHIHCKYGYSRSVAVHSFIQDLVLGNQHVLALLKEACAKRNRDKVKNIIDFNIKPIRIGFDLTELQDYYNKLNSNFQHLCWKSDMVDDTVGYEEHKLKGCFGWGIQSNIPDISVPCPPYNVHKDGTDNYVDTELVFGLAKKIRDKYPWSRQLSIAAHPPETIIRLHTDTDSYFKVHLPIYSNDKAYFLFEDESYVMEPGKAYLVNTSRMHGTHNMGNTTRIHFFFKVPYNEIPTLL